MLSIFLWCTNFDALVQRFGLQSTKLVLWIWFALIFLIIIVCPKILLPFHGLIVETGCSATAFSDAFGLGQV